MIKLVVFDLDDTLITEKSYAESAFKEISMMLIEVLGNNSKNIFDTMIKCYETDPKKVFDNTFHEFNVPLTNAYKSVLIDCYRNHKPNLKLTVRTHKLFHEIKERNIKLGLITDGYKITQHNKIDVLDLNQYMDKIIVTDDLGREYWKPHQLAFKLMKEYFGLDNKEIMYVGDNINKDFIAPNELGMISVMVKSSNGVYYNDNAVNDNQKPRFTISDLSEILNIIDSEIIQ